jgi:uncharacterized protein YabN with tetrapyrrole methylase and pyrophosphatase domain
MRRATKNGSLVIVGTGISLGQMTVETREHIKTARNIVALVADPVTLAWLKECNPRTESLHRFYSDGKDRRITYAEIVEYVMNLLRRGRQVCFVLYGHPGVFAFPPHELMRRTRHEGIPARMLAAVSTEDCLFADLGVDPGASGCQSFEATDFLLRRRKFDPCSALILWQFGVIGELSCPKRLRRDCVRVLVERLEQSYPGDHEVVLYEAAIYPLYKPIRRRVRLSSLARTKYMPISTLYVPPLADRPASSAVKRRLGWK